MYTAKIAVPVNATVSNGYTPKVFGSSSFCVDLILKIKSTQNQTVACISRRDGPPGTLLSRWPHGAKEEILHSERIDDSARCGWGFGLNGVPAIPASCLCHP
jgi:hypothetical protein